MEYVAYYFFWVFMDAVIIKTVIAVRKFHMKQKVPKLVLPNTPFRNMRRKYAKFFVGDAFDRWVLNETWRHLQDFVPKDKTKK